MQAGIETRGIIADRRNKINGMPAFIGSQGAEAVTPAKSYRKDPWEYDWTPCRTRNLIERAFNKLKRWIRSVTGFDRKSLYFLSAWHLAPAFTCATNCRLTLRAAQRGVLAQGAGRRSL